MASARIHYADLKGQTWLYRRKDQDRPGRSA